MTVDTEVRHPLFARFFAQFSRLMERELGDRRRQLLDGLSGSVPEIGAGNGMNFPRYGQGDRVGRLSDRAGAELWARPDLGHHYPHILGRARAQG
jgi:hypothetical protein